MALTRPVGHHRGGGKQECLVSSSSGVWPRRFAPATTSSIEPITVIWSGRERHPAGRWRSSCALPRKRRVEVVFHTMNIPFASTELHYPAPSPRERMSYIALSGTLDIYWSAEPSTPT
jgi:hypothetical protein